jgi:isoamylase
MMLCEKETTMTGNSAPLTRRPEWAALQEHSRKIKEVHLRQLFADDPPRIRPVDAIIYELHVRGFTQHPSCGVYRPGMFAGLVEKIPYPQALGVNAVELMPVWAFERPTAIA